MGIDKAWVNRGRGGRGLPCGWFMQNKEEGRETVSSCRPAHPATVLTSTFPFPIRKVEMTACVLSDTNINQLVGRSAQVRFG